MLKLNLIKAIQAFNNTKAIFAHTTTLSYEDHSKPLMLFTDASDTHVGAVLEQEGENGEMRPLAYFSKKLPPLKTVRSNFYKELCALYLSLKHFQYRILCRRLLIRRVILPEKLRLTAYNASHNRLHLGIEKTIESIARTFWWPMLRDDVSH